MANYEMTTPVTIDDLPPEMISELFKHLRLKHLVVCSMVCKRWYSIYCDFKVDRLVAIEVAGPAPRRWYESDRMIESNEYCTEATFICLMEQPLLSNLKYFSLNDFNYEFDLGKLNLFQQLVHLEINVCYAHPSELCLPNLKVLVFSKGSPNDPLSIVCPLLDVLVYKPNDFFQTPQSALKMKHPETIRKLETNLFDQQLAPFKNVEYLITNRFEAISKATLLTLPKLKELRYSAGIWRAFGHLNSGRGVFDQDLFKRTKRALREFLCEVTTLKASDFRFEFAGFQLTKTMLNRMDFDLKVGRDPSQEEFYWRNHHLIEPGALRVIDSVFYSLLSSSTPEEFPVGYTQIFADLSIHADVVEDEKRFLDFLKSLSTVDTLRLECNLSQEFYDHLPASVHSLNHLVFDREPKMPLSFDFIDKFSGLPSLSFNGPVSIEMLTSLVRHLDRVEMVVCLFSVNEQYFYFQKCRETSLFQTGIAFESKFRTNNVTALLNYFERIQVENHNE